MAALQPDLSGFTGACSRRCSFKQAIHYRKKPGFRRVCATSGPPHDLELQTVKDAQKRLHNLLAAVGDGEQELVLQAIQEENSELKVSMVITASAILASAAQLVCWLVGVDIWGGASLSLSSLKYGGIGALAALPLVVSYIYLESPLALKQMPFLKDIQIRNIEDYGPLLEGLSPVQTQALMVAETVPGIFLLLPAGVGVISHILQLGCDAANVEIPEKIPLLLGLMISSLYCSVSNFAQQTASYEEWEVVRDAIDNAPRYYRALAMGRDSTGADAEHAALVFKAVAATWLATKSMAAQFSGLVNGLEAVYLGFLWIETKDLTTPLVAVLLSSAYKFEMWRRITNKGGIEK